MRFRHGLSVAAGLVVLLACARDRWKGVVYPDKQNLLRFTYIGTYSSLDDCRAASHAVLHALGDTSHADYECGRNCAGTPSARDVMVCDETQR